MPVPSVASRCQSAGGTGGDRREQGPMDKNRAGTGGAGRKLVLTGGNGEQGTSGQETTIDRQGRSHYEEEQG